MGFQKQLWAQILFLATLGSFGSSCQIASLWSDDDSQVKTDEGKSDDAKSKGDKKVADENRAEKKALDDLEAKQAKLYARVDELEEKVERQKERMKVLERGLVLGLVPGELQLDGDRGGANEKGRKDKAKKKQPARTAEVIEPSSEDVPSAEIATKLPSETKSKLTSPTDDAEYQKHLAMAQEHFRAGRYGRAIAEYSAIGRDYGEKDTSAAHKFWIALSWANLKEFQTSKQLFEEFLKENALSPWVPRAKLELSRVDVKLGLRDKAVTELRGIIRDFPYEDAAEMAKMELNNIQKAL